MKSKILILMGVIVIASELCGFSAYAKDEDIMASDKVAGEKISAAKNIDAGANFDFVSRYLWRGVYFTDGIVWQPSAWVSKWGFTSFVWSNYILNNEYRQWKFTEVDLGLSYEHKFAGLTVRPSFIYYLYPYNFGESTGEASLYLSYPLGPIYIFTTQNFDVKEYRKSYYADLGFGFEKELNEYLSINLSTKLAWASSRFNEVYYKVSKTTVDNLSFNLSMIAKFTTFLYARPYLQYALLVDDALRKTPDGPNRYCVGLSIGATY